MEEVVSIERLQKNAKSTFEILPTGYKINIEFSNLTYEVPDYNKGTKCILKNVNGGFRSGQLSVIMGPSGSGKTTLINLLAGYRIHKTSGSINVNNNPHNIELLRKMSRYILQDDHISPHFTVMESMLYAAEFKLNRNLSAQQYIDEINKVLKTLHLAKQVNTKVSNLSGGEKKRLCIALELLNTPTVLFLDEPITGLDEVSAMQCMSILRLLAASGRTVVCVLHAPPARMFQTFDHVYILAYGECVYQGSATSVLPYLSKIGLECPITYNPADFIIEVAAREYGNYHKTMVNEVKNGQIIKWLPAVDVEKNQNECLLEEFQMEVNTNAFADITTPWLLEYKTLYIQMLKQMWRDKAFIKLKVFIQLFLVFFISLVYEEIGTNASMTIYNYHFVILASIITTFVSMCPMLSHIPLEINCMRREHINQWYRLSSYYMALITSQLPEIFLLGFISSALLYFLTGQPVELNRFLLFALVMLLTSMTASSYGIALSSRFNLLHSLFFGPCIIACWIVLANHGVDNPELSTFEKVLMYSGFIRHSVEGLMSALFEFNRPDAICPADVVFCFLKKPKALLKIMGCYINVKCRLSNINFLEQNHFYQALKKVFRNVYLKSY